MLSQQLLLLIIESGFKSRAVYYGGRTVPGFKVQQQIEANDYQLQFFYCCSSQV